MEHLKIIYRGNMIKVTPVEVEGRTQFLVHMSNGDLKIEMAVKEDRNRFWQEVGRGESNLANELGALIEEAEHS